MSLSFFGSIAFFSGAAFCPSVEPSIFLGSAGAGFLLGSESSSVPAGDPLFDFIAALFSAAFLDSSSPFDVFSSFLANSSPCDVFSFGETLASSILQTTVALLPCTLTTNNSTTSPGVNSSAGLGRPEAWARKFVAKPASKKIPNVFIVSTMPSNLSPCLTSETRRRVDTSKAFFSMLMARILKPSIFSPATYSESGLLSWLALHRASFSAPTSKKRPRVVLMVWTMPDTT
mmetsp:Transcript_28420/g.72910  ORF Transcript_28420/g.72910 Transcript_28420/m.72910 type:complete len:231 (-) Transcript_28420:130-822(-)